LQDLLNPASPDEEPSFFVNDPYNAAALDEDEDEDDELTITRGSEVDRLEIDELIDLANSKLVARYSDALANTSSHQPAVAAQPSSNVPATPWTEDIWAAKDADF
jgi:hypothetical protein